MGLVCFRLKGSNEVNQKLLSNINASGKLHMVPASVHGRYVIRFCVCAQDAKDSDIDFAWDVITDFATELLESETVKEKSGVPLQVLQTSNQEVGQVTHKVEIAELMELMERTQVAVRNEEGHKGHADDANGPAYRRPSSQSIAPKAGPTKLAKKLSKRQFSFTNTIEFIGITNVNSDAANPH